MIDRLRALRVWHWRQVLSNRALAVRTEQQRSAKTLPDEPWISHLISTYHANANLHLTFVQSLNEVCEGTAEEDDHDPERR